MKLAVSFEESLRRVEFSMDSDGLGSFMWLPEESIRFKMEVWVSGRSCDFVSNYGNKLAMMKDSCVELLLPRMQHSFVERNVDLDWGFDPVSATAFVFPIVLAIRAFALPSA